MGLYPGWTPWLSKPDVVRHATRAIVESAMAARAAAGYLDCATRSGTPFWLPPRSRSPLDPIEAHAAHVSFDAEPGSLEHGIDYLAKSSTTLGAGSFVFVLSDFLEPLPHSLWLAGQARRWEIVPVVIQDPTWEQSFPSVDSVVLPIADPGGRPPLRVRLRRSEARAERTRRENARADLLAGFAALGLDPVLIDRSGLETVLHRFSEWAERRRRTVWQRW
jgi:hypothetical protein